MSNKDTPSWPPKSPYEVLLLTPKKDRQQVPGSPSPMVTDDHYHHNQRRGPPSPSPRRRGRRAELEEDTEMGTDDDEDEEYLRLKLARIEAKLKLKQLQRKRKRTNSVCETLGEDGSTVTTSNGNGNTPKTTTTTTTSNSTSTGISNAASISTATPSSFKFQHHPHLRESTPVPGSASRSSRPGFARAVTPPPQVQVPGSPQKQPPPSPSRVLLGLDRGLRAKDVSLRRPPNLRFGQTPGASRPGTSTSTQSGSTFSDVFSSRPNTTSTTGSSSITFGRDPSPSRPVVKSFNQRIVEARAAENEKKAKQASIDGSRSRGFGLTAEEMAVASSASTSMSQAPLSSLDAIRLGVSAEQPKVSIWATPSISTSFTSGGGGGIAKSDIMSHSFDATKSISFDAAKSISFDGGGNTKSINPGSSSTAQNSISTSTSSDATTGSGYDSFSHLHLSTRILPHTTLSRALQQKTIYLLPDLLKTVVSPAYDPPDTEGDWVVMGIISSKSEPRQTAKSAAGTNTNTNNTSDKNTPGGDKYMVMTLTDLKWDIELFLFGGGFERFWKVGVGTVVAILNPGILRPRNADTGRFSLTLNSREDTVLEVGMARDLGFCKSVKRDGKPCGSWVDRRRMEFCSFHVEMAVKRNQNSRMELNNMGKMFSPPRKGRGAGAGGGGGGGGSRFLGRSGGRFTAGGGSAGGSFKDDGLLPEGPLPDLPQRVGGAGGKVFVYPSRGSNALFDDSFQDAFHNGSREDRLKRQLAKGEREREVARKLVAAQRNVGGGLASTGAEYLRIALEEEERRKVREGVAAAAAASAGGAGGAANGEAKGNKFEGAAEGIVESLGPTMKSLGLSRGRVSRNHEDYTTLTNRTTSTTEIHLSPIKRRKNFNRPANATASANSTSTSTSISSMRAPPSTPMRDANDPGPLKKRPRVHFNRPVVTGGVGGSGGGGGVGGGGGGGNNDSDDDDDLEIM
ncbi:hypothetical protein DFH27DRAFT_524030 [Peziza echinospora]|nr:hypothetical protein DFH27DRAFT_524030 [Peziza echinospora]